MFGKSIYVALCTGKSNWVLQIFPETNPLADARNLQSTAGICCEPGILHASNPPPCLNRGVLSQKKTPNRLLFRDFPPKHGMRSQANSGYHGPIVDLRLPHRNLAQLTQCAVVGEHHLLFDFDPSRGTPTPQKPILLDCLNRPPVINQLPHRKDVSGWSP